jgi:aminopeptidase N
MRRAAWAHALVLGGSLALAPAHPGVAQEPGAPPQEPPPITAGRAAPEGTYVADGIDVVHYDVEMALPRTGQVVEGLTRVRVQAQVPLDTVRLDFTGLAVREIAVDARPVEGWRHDGGRLHVPLPRTVPAGGRTEVTVRYTGTPDDGLIVGRTVHGDPSAFVDNWPNRTRFWLPSADHPSDKATARFTVHAPAAWQVVANGRLVGQPFPTPPDALGADDGPRRSWIWETSVPHATYTLVVGGAEMQVDRVGLAACGRAPASPRADGCIEVSTWLFPESVAAAAPSFVRAAEMVDFFTDVVGPFPYEKLAHVQSATRFGGMENSSAIFYDQGALAAGRDIEATVSHETAHQWFGDSVTEAEWSHLWLSEGFATYFGTVFFEYVDGPTAFRERMDAVRSRYLASGDSVRPVIDERDDLFELLNRNSYQKGAAILHMLRGLVGDETFFRGVAAYYERFRDATALTDDLQGVMEEVSGQELDWFFDQWLRAPGHPTLQLRTAPAEGGGGVAVTVRQVQQDPTPVFRLPLTLDLVWEGGRERHEVVVDARTATFTLPGVPPDARVEVDPEGWLLARIVP